MEMQTILAPKSGSSSPLGATPHPEGVNFSLFSKHATGVELLLFEEIVNELPLTRVQHARR
jgi:glycogen operon protein